LNKAGVSSQVGS